MRLLSSIARKWLRFPPPLHVAVLLLMLACGVICFLIQAFVVVRWQIDSIVVEQQQGADFFVTRLARKMGGRIQDSREWLTRSDLALLEAFPTVRWVGACGPDGRFVNCTKPTWVGQRLADVAPAEASSLAVQAKTTSKVVFQRRGKETVLAARRVPHSLDEPEQYVVLAERDVSEAVSTLRRAQREAALATAGMFALFCLLVWAVFFFFIRHRMHRLIKYAGLRGAAQPALEALPGGDEFSEISKLLNETEHLLRDITDNLEEIVWIVSPDLKILYVSPAFARIFKIPREDVVMAGSQLPEFIPKDHKLRLRDAFEALREGAPDLNVEHRILRGDGELRWMLSRGFPVRDEVGRLQRIVGISRDTTDEVRLQEQIVSISEQERHSVSYDLHDDACQRLAAMKLKSETLTEHLKQEHSPQLRIAKELTSQISGTSALLRNIARGLAPVELDGQGFSFALRKLILTQEAIHEVPCFYREDETVVIDSKVVAAHLYRIAQEFIANAARHGSPTQIEIRMDQTQDHVRLRVTNDGKPFLNASSADEGMGLKIVRYRANIIEGTISIRPREGGTPGTVAECFVPRDICSSATGAPTDPHVWHVADVSI